MYSLTSIPTLCYDLVRSPTGAAWGDVLERALRLRTEDMAALQELAWQSEAGDGSGELGPVPGVGRDRRAHADRPTNVDGPA